MRIFKLDKTKKFYRGSELGNFAINSTPAKIGSYKDIVIYPAVCISYKTKDGYRYDVPIKPEYFGVKGFMYSSMITMGEENTWETIWVINPKHYKNEIMFPSYLEDSKRCWRTNLYIIWIWDFKDVCSLKEFIKNPLKYIFPEKFKTDEG